MLRRALVLRRAALRSVFLFHRPAVGLCTASATRFRSSSAPIPSSPPAAGRAPAPSLYNSLTQRVEPLPPTRDPNTGALRRLTWYSCGPTVYDSTHLGHARSYVSTDVLRRVLGDVFGYRVHFVLGMTDVDDKIIQRAWDNGEPAATLARRCEAEFMEDLDVLGVLPPCVVTRVTEHIPEIIDYVANIMRNGHAYQLDDGVYFDVASLGERYARELGPAEAREAEAIRGEVVQEAAGAADVVPGGKRDRRDFALWKKLDMDNHAKNSVSWDSPWGAGRPGWHIECSAMTHAVLGSRFDLHSGGIDLCFPHHCNEVAQAQAFNQQDEWVSSFLHTGHLYIEGRKMSKSLKNFITVRDMLGTSGSGNGDGDVDPAAVKDASVAFRMFVLSHHYRSNITYSVDRMKDARVEVGRFRRFIQSMERLAAKSMIAASASDAGDTGVLDRRAAHRVFFLDATARADTAGWAALADDCWATAAPEARPWHWTL